MKRYVLVLLTALAAVVLTTTQAAVVWANPPERGATRTFTPASPGLVGPVCLPDLHTLARQHEAHGEYQQALRLYEQLLQRPNVSTSVRLRAGRCALHAKVAHRYHDPSFRSLLSSQTSAQAYGLVRHVWGKTRRYYVEPVSYARLVELALTGLEVACENVHFRRAHPCVTSDNATPFVEHVRQRRASLGDKDLTLTQAMAIVERTCHTARGDLGLDPPAVAMEMVFGSVESLDNYTDLLTPNEIIDVCSLVDGKFVGIGVEVDVVPFGLLVVMPLAGSPAEEHHINPGDLIVGVDGESTIGWTPERAGARLQGPAGSTIVLDVVSRGTTAKRRMRLERRQLAIKSVRCARMLAPDQGIGYIHLSSFQRSTVRELDDALRRLDGEGLSALVLDLRGNPGGLVRAAVQVADRFVASGVIVSTRGRAWNQNWIHRAHRTGTRKTMPLVVLIDGRSASASEIVAGAIRDHQRGRLVGERSFGKGNVQSVFDLPNVPLGLRLTTAKYYSPRGECFSRVGIRPDVAVGLAPQSAFGRLTHDPRAGGAMPDTQLARAAAILSDSLSNRVSRR